MGKGEGAEFQRKLINNGGTLGREENDLGSSSTQSGLHCQFSATKRTLESKIFKKFLYLQIPIEN